MSMEDKSLASEKFPGTLCACAICNESLPSRREEWTYVICCGFGVCRHCLSQNCPRCGEALPKSQDICIEKMSAKADTGCVSTQFELGQFFLHQRKREAAAHYLAMAALQEHVEAAFLLGFHHDDGLFDRDHRAAKNWYALAATSGHCGAKMFLDHLPQK